jgi:hypothetical protein
MADGYPYAADIKLEADQISETFSKCESTCLDVGMRLGDAIPGLIELSEVFETLSQSLESDSFRAANQDLQAVATDIIAIGQALTGESEGLTSLVHLNKKISRQIEAVASNIRTIMALVFNVKIEAASLTVTADNNMMDFAQGLQVLAVNAQRAIDEYQITHSKLYELLQSTASRQLSFQDSHQQRLISIALEIGTSLEVILQRRREIAAASAEIKAQSQQIGLHIGQGVVALQVGDSTRQRIEHVHRALCLAADLLDPQSSQFIDESLDKTKNAVVASTICNLQSKQLSAALMDFDLEMNNIAQLLQHLADDSESLAARGLGLSGASGNGKDSFLEKLEKKLEAVNVLVQESYQARVIVDHAAVEVSASITNMDTQTARLSEIVVDMTMLGMNAVLKSTRLGQGGKGLNVIALELRNYALQVVGGIKELKPAINEVMAIIRQLSEAGQTQKAEQMMQIKDRMASAIKIFRLSGKQMSDATSGLEKEANDIGKLLNRAVLELDSRHEIRETLLKAVSSIDEFASAIHNGDRPDEKCIAYIDDILFDSYTMECEREIHDDVIYDPNECKTSRIPATQTQNLVDADQFLF